MRRLLQLTLFCLLAITTVIQTFAADPVYTVNMDAGKAPTKTWPINNNGYKGTITSKDKKWTLTNANNNNINKGTCIRIGPKNAEISSSLTSKFAISQKIGSVSFDIYAWLRKGTDTAGAVTAINVQVCPDSDFAESNTQTYSLSTMPTQEGEITIPIENPVADQYYKINITCKNSADKHGVIDIDWFKFYPVAESSDTRQDVSLSWSESAVSTNIGETFTAPTLTVNPDKAKSSLVYSSSDKSVAEIANDGTVTIKAVGQTTITVAIPDDNATYKPKSASYTLTVIDPNEVYYLVKSLADFDETQESILVAWNPGSYQAAMGAQNRTKEYREAVPYSPIATSLPEYLNAPDGTVPFILEPVPNDSTYYIKVGEKTYLNLNSKSTNTNEVTDKSLYTAIDLSFNTDNRATLQISGVSRILGYNYNNGSHRFASYSTTNDTYSNVYLYQKRSATPALGDITFTPAPGSEVPINSKVTISCKNATQISYSITKNEGPSTTVVVPGSVAEVTITEDCIIEAKGTNEEGDSKIADADYAVQEPFTLYTDFYEETGAPYIPDGNYVLVGSVSTGESAGEYYMAEQKDTYRVANKIQPLEDGRLPIDNKYQINIKKENGNYSLIVAEGKYLYAESSTTTSDSGTTTTYSVKEGDAAAGQGKWKANIEKGKVYFSWADNPSYGDFKFNPQSPRFKTYKPDSNSMVSFSLYSTNIPLCRDLKFDHADGSTVVRGSTVTISCINAAKIFYSVNSPSNVKVVEGNKASVIISDVCLITAYAENAAGDRSGEISAFYTVIDPYVQFTGYGSDGSVPDGKYLFVGENASTKELSYMAAEDIDSDYSIYRNAVEVTPFEDGRIGVSESFAINVKKEESGKYSLITADGKYLYAYSSTDPSGEGESQTTTTTYSVIGGDADQGQGQWTANVADNKVEFAWSDPNMGTLRFNSGKSRFKTYVGSTGTKFYLYAPTPKPAQVVCTDATIINKEIKISVNKTITFHSEGAGKMACEILEEDEERNSVETFDIVDGDTYVFTTSPKATYQVVNIIPYDQYGAAHTPSSLCVGVTTFNLPKISYHFVDGKDEAAFYAENGDITEIRPYRIDGTLEEAGTYPDNVITFKLNQPRFKVTAQNEIGDTVEENFSFIQELCNRKNIEGGAYTVAINYKDANSEADASFPIAETELGSLKWTMDGYLVNESDDILETYPFLIKKSYITLHIAPYGADGPTILNVKKIATPADGGEGVYGAPAHASAEGDLPATIGNYNFVQNGGSHFYFDGQGKNFIKGNIEVSPFEYANISITSIDDVTTEVSDILDEDAEEVFYNLQGVRVENPDKGIYIRVKGNKTEKILK